MRSKTSFHITFYNVPYSDTEWKIENERRKYLRENYPHSYGRKNYAQELKTRPNHAFTYHSTVYSESEAIKICENALKGNRAQKVEYSLFNPQNSLLNSTFEKRKGKKWKQIK